MRRITLTLLLLFFRVGFAQAQTSVEDLSIALRLPVDQFSQAGLEFIGEGSFYQYFVETEGRQRGVLIPVRDQSCTGQPCAFFSPVIQRGQIADDVAGAVFDKIYQLFDQRSFGGPEVIGLAEVDDDGLSDLGIVVEHLNGGRLRLGADTPPEQLEQFERLFFEILDRDWVPLDFRADNVVHGESGRGLRPVDIGFETPLNLISLESRNPRLYELKMIQLAHSILTVRAHFSTVGKVARRCRDFVGELNESFPASHRHQLALEHRYLLAKP